MKFIEVHMFKDQKGAGRASAAPATATLTQAIAFLQWKEKYIVRRKSGADATEYTIVKIDSPDGKMAYNGCTVTLKSAADETVELKGSTLQSGYAFVSKGDAEKDGLVEAPAKKPGKFDGREDLQPMSIALDGIREFHPRTKGRDGTRIIMKDKTIYVVQEHYDEVKSQIKGVVAGTWVESTRTLEDSLANLAGAIG